VCGYLDNETGVAERSAKAAPAAITGANLDDDDDDDDDSVDSDAAFASYADRRIRSIVNKVVVDAYNAPTEPLSASASASASAVGVSILTEAGGGGRESSLAEAHTLNVIDEVDMIYWRKYTCVI
jgi:hypothetical protein